MNDRRKTNAERFVETGELPEHVSGCDCLICDYRPYIAKREQKIRKIGEAALLRMGVMASTLAAKYDDVEAARIIQDIQEKYDELMTHNDSYKT